LVAGTNVVEQNTLRAGEAIVHALLDAGLAPDAAANTFWGVHYFLLGLVQEEQSEDGDAREKLSDQLADADFPALSRVQRGLLSTSFDERFEFGIDALLRSAQRTHQ